MADFEKYYPVLERREGGYASAAFAKKINDSGGETYLGIARNFNPEWEGWAWIDEWIKNNGEPKWNSYIPDPRLKPSAKKFSKKKYWDFLNLDQVNNQSVAELICDYGYNSGRTLVAKKVQRYLGIKDDGIIGIISVNKINEADQQALHEHLVSDRVTLIWGLDKFDNKIKSSLAERAKSFKFVA